MRPIEADRLRALLLAHGPAAASPLLNVGSQTGHFRAVKKPHVAALFDAIAAAGFAVVHADLQAGDGVDETGDLLDPAVIARLKGRGFRAVLSNNLLEHVTDPAALCASCEEIAGPGGLLFITVPRSHPFHADPIDTLFRPSPQDIAALCPRSDLIAAEVLEVGGVYDDPRLRGPRGRLTIAAKFVWRLLNAPRRPLVARAELDRLRWIGRPVTVSLAVLRVREAG